MALPLMPTIEHNPSLHMHEENDRMVKQPLVMNLFLGPAVQVLVLFIENLDQRRFDGALIGFPEFPAKSLVEGCAGRQGGEQFPKRLGDLFEFSLSFFEIPVQLE